MEIKRLIRKYFVADVAISVVTWLLFYGFRWAVNDSLIFTDTNIITPSFNFYLAITFYPLCCVFVAYLTGFYDSAETRSRIVELVSTLVGTLFSSLITFFAILIDDVVVSYRFYYQAFLVLWLTQFVLMYLVRFCITQHYFSRIRKGKIQFNTLIVGTGVTAEQTAQTIENKMRFYGSHVVGFVRVNSKAKKVSGRIVGNLAKIDAIIKQHNIRTIIVAIEQEDDAAIYDVINRVIKYQDIDLNIIPRQLGIITERVTMGDIDSVPLISLSALAMPAWQRSLKRTFDVVTSLVAIVLLAPFLIVVSIAIKCTSRGAIFYKQERIGKNGKPFVIYKFRSMYEHAETDVPQLTQENDARITPFGKTLRKYRIDELPQLFNILKGDMSIVGPRPERAYFINQITEIAPYYCLLYKIKPGLLSWGPIKVGYTHTVEEMKERLNYDIIYMDNMSIFNDLKIIVYSIEIILKGKGI